MMDTSNTFRTALGTSLAVVVLLAAGHVRAQAFVIDIKDANFRPFPVAAPTFQTVVQSKEYKKLARNLTSTLQEGVEIARALELVPPKSYLASPKEDWTSPGWADWQNVAASGLIRGYIEIKGDKISVSFRFYDVTGQRQLLSRTYEVKKKNSTQAVYEFLDDLIKELTGESGIFSTRIAYVKPTSGGKAVFVSNMDGTGESRVTPVDALSLLPEFDLSGRYVLFTSYLKDNPDLYRKDLRSGNMEWLSKKRGLNTGAAVSPDGKRIALTLSLDGNTEIYVMSWNGKNLKRLTDSWGPDVSPAWSPDGRRIAFVSQRSGQPHIYVMHADGSSPKRITFQGNYNQEPDWSPRRGGKIAFTARDEFLKYDIFLVDPETTEISRLTQDDGSNQHPSFSPDGQHILFTTTRMKAGKKLYIMDVDGRNQRRISKGGGHFEDPVWGPRMGYR